MKKFQLTFISLLALTGSACSQKQDKESATVRSVGDRCEGCEAILEYGSKKLQWIDTLPDYREAGSKMEINGTIYQSDGKTPAANVILYIYHTDQNGKYTPGKNQNGAG